MQLLRAGPSPFVRKVLVTLHETGHALYEQGIAPALLGADPLDIADCESRCVPPWPISCTNLRLWPPI